VERIISVVDKVAPVITLLGRNPFEMIKGEWYTEKDPGYVVTDNYYAANQIAVTIDTSGLNTNVGGVYYVFYRAEDPSGNKSSIEFREVRVMFNVGLNDNLVTSGMIRVYPNPSTGKIRLVSNESVIQIAIYDLNGKLVQQIDKPETDADIFVKGEGLLFVHIKTESNNIIQKLLITR
jgi:hypothetical protein